MNEQSKRENIFREPTSQRPGQAPGTQFWNTPKNYRTKISFNGICWLFAFVLSIEITGLSFIIFIPIWYQIPSIMAHHRPSFHSKKSAAWTIDRKLQIKILLARRKIFNALNLFKSWTPAMLGLTLSRVYYYPVKKLYLSISPLNWLILNPV